MTELGAQLRAARLAKGYAIADLAALTHIRAPYLAALEDGRYAELPGRAYGLGFVKSVAREIGLDPVETASKFSFESVAVEPGRPHPMFLNFEKAGQPRLQMLLAAAMLALAGLAVWKTISPSQAHAPGMVEEVPAKIRQAAEMPADSPSLRNETMARNWRVDPQPSAEQAAQPTQLARYTASAR